MDTDWWTEVETIFHNASNLSGADREAYLGRACGSGALRQEVDTLLAEFDRAEGFLSHSLRSAALTLAASRFASEHLQPGNQVAYYTIKKLIGQGGMGSVYLAEDDRLGRLVALKILPGSYASNPEAVTRFQMEAKAASQISHPNVAHIYEFGHDHGLYYLSMEYVQGSLLRELLVSGPVDPGRAVDIASQCALALSAAHSLGIVHRDIKPDNILITDGGLVKVLDFGIAKWEGEKAEQADRNAANDIETSPGLVLGTTAYMSPEQVRGLSVDGRSDIWALGVVLFEMLSGKRPFSGETRSDVRASILRDDPPPIRRKIKHRKTVNAIVKRCLEKDRHNRYQSPTELRGDLEKLSNAIDGRAVNKGFFDSLRVHSVRFAVYAAIFCSILGAFYAISSYTVSTLLPRLPNRLSATKIESMVIVPFDVDAGKGSFDKLQYFSRDLDATLNSEIGSANFCRLKAGGARFQGSQDLGAIRKTLGATTVLRGTIKERSDGSTEVLTEIVAAGTGDTVWQDKVVGPTDDLLKLRNNLYIRLALALRPLTEYKGFFLLGQETSTPDRSKAYDAYLEGRYSGPLSGDPRKPIQKLEEAASLGGNSYRVNLALAQSYYTLSRFDSQGQNHRETAKNYAVVAEYLGSSYEGYLFNAAIKMDDGDWQYAEKAIKLALASNPNGAEAHYQYGGVFLAARGEFEKAISELETARDIDPLSSRYDAAIGWVKILAGDQAGALNSCNAAVKMSSQSVEGYTCAVRALTNQGRFQEAIQTAQQLVANDPTLVGGDSRTELAIAYARAGRTSDALKVVEDFLRDLKAGNRTVTPHQLADIYACLGDKQNALTFLEKDVQQKSKKSIYIKVDPLLEPVRGDVRYKNLLLKEFSFLLG
jgi:serine/threonine protein kinase/tetratricopeptide (TPR) repeat protein